MPKDYIFIYGTLRKKFSHPISEKMLHYCTFIDYGFFRGRLFEIEGYPGAIATQHNAYPVRGEIYKIHENERLLTLLDNYEECSKQYPHPHEYVRKKLDISTDDSRVIQCWVYLYNRDVSGLKEIISGNYVGYI